MTRQEREKKIIIGGNHRISLHNDSNDTINIEVQEEALKVATEKKGQSNESYLALRFDFASQSDFKKSLKKSISSNRSSKKYKLNEFIEEIQKRFTLVTPNIDPKNIVVIAEPSARRYIIGKREGLGRPHDMKNALLYSSKKITHTTDRLAPNCIGITAAMIKISHSINPSATKIEIYLREDPWTGQETIIGGIVATEKFLPLMTPEQKKVDISFEYYGTGQVAKVQCK